MTAYLAPIALLIVSNIFVTLVRYGRPGDICSRFGSRR
jgi:uncharacterized protein (DUF486 family)